MSENQGTKAKELKERISPLGRLPMVGGWENSGGN